MLTEGGPISIDTRADADTDEVEDGVEPVDNGEEHLAAERPDIIESNLRRFFTLPPLPSSPARLRSLSSIESSLAVVAVAAAGRDCRSKADVSSPGRGSLCGVEEREPFKLADRSSTSSLFLEATTGCCCWWWWCDGVLKLRSIPPSCGASASRVAGVG